MKDYKNYFTNFKKIFYYNVLALKNKLHYAKQFFGKAKILKML